MADRDRDLGGMSDDLSRVGDSTIRSLTEPAEQATIRTPTTPSSARRSAVFPASPLARRSARSRGLSVPSSARSRARSVGGGPDAQCPTPHPRTLKTTTSTIAATSSRAVHRTLDLAPRARRRPRHPRPRWDPRDQRAMGSTSSANRDYDAYRPAYQLGHVASRNPDYADRDFDAVEADLRRGWTDDVSQQYGSWDRVRDRARQGFERGRERRLTLSEEQLAVGKRQVQAGEAAVRKTVETEHVRQSVPVQREEVVVERRPISGDRASDVDIREDEVRIPLMAEEVVVEKRAVPTEEIVIQKRVVTEEREVEADLRRERVDDSELRNTTSRTADTVAGATESAADRGGNAIERGARKVADKLDDVKDRVDGNPASRPGPDATDRR